MPPDHDRITALFIHRKPAYTAAEAQAVLGIPDEEFAPLLRAADQEADDAGNSILRWETVAHLALGVWTPRMIEDVLGRDAIPYLNQHCTVRIRLPRYLIRYLHHRASEEARVPRNASDVLTRILQDDVNGHDARMIDVDIPGFFEAHFYPAYTPTGKALYHRCRYCDITITTPGRNLCATCKQRHES